ncbi:MAG: hypothetical protein VKO00_11070 [Cyanobacteriota bacterium]|nr:hypothetical protein [Cyanobacteriota bacterium]
MSRAPLAGRLALVVAGLCLGAPAQAQLSETQIRYDPVVLATTCELTPRDGALNYDQNTRRTISSEGTPGAVRATLSGLVGTGTPSGPVVTFENPTLIGGSPAVSEVRVGQGSYSQRQMVAFDRGANTLDVETDVRFQSVAAFPDGTYSATVDVMCFQAGF